MLALFVLTFFSYTDTNLWLTLNLPNTKIIRIYILRELKHLKSFHAVFIFMTCITEFHKIHQENNNYKALFPDLAFPGLLNSKFRLQMTVSAVLKLSKYWMLSPFSPWKKPIAPWSMDYHLYFSLTVNVFFLLIVCLRNDLHIFVPSYHKHLHSSAQPSLYVVSL